MIANIFAVLWLLSFIVGVGWLWREGRAYKEEVLECPSSDDIEKCLHPSHQKEIK